MSDRTMRLYKGLDKDYCDWHTGKNKHVQGATFSIAKKLRSKELCSSGMFHASRKLFHTSKYGYCATAAEILVDEILQEHEDDKCGFHTYKVVRSLDNEQVREQLESGLREELGHAIDLRPITYFFRRKRRPTKDDIALLRKWYSVRESVWESVWYSVWDSVRDSVRDSVWASVRSSVLDSVLAYLGSLFQEVTAWKYVTHDDGVYPFQAAADLVKRGLMPAFDGTKIFLLSGKSFDIVHEDMKKNGEK